MNNPLDDAFAAFDDAVQTLEEAMRKALDAADQAGFERAIKQMRDRLGAMVATVVELEPESSSTSPGSQARDDRAQLLSTRLADLSGPKELGIRAYNALSRQGIHTLGDLVQLSEEQVLDDGFRGFGQSSLDRVRRVLGKRGLAMKGETPPAMR